MTARRAHGAPRIDFQVTQEHIDTAIPKDSAHCMIADALRAAIPGAGYVSVDLATIRWTDEAAGWRYIYLTPGYAQVALLDFDQGVKPQPFRIRANAAQMVPTGGARRRHRAAMDAGVEQDVLETGMPGRNKTPPLVRPPYGSVDSVPVKVGGNPLPTGELSGGATPGANRRGKRREFGLRRFTR